MMPEYNAFAAWLGEKGWMLGGEALQDVATATTVRVRDGRRIVTDGPFAETKEHLGGYYLIDAPDLDDAIEAAARIPGAAARQGRGPPDHGDGLIDGCRARDGRAPGPARRRRPRLPRGARAGARHADPRPRRLRPRRGGGRGRLRHGARALAGRRRPGATRAPGSRRPRATGRSTGSGARARSPRRPRRSRATRRSTRRRARARCSRPWRTRCTRSRTTGCG